MSTSINTNVRSGSLSLPSHLLQSPSGITSSILSRAYPNYRPNDPTASSSNQKTLPSHPNPNEIQNNTDAYRSMILDEMTTLPPSQTQTQTQTTQLNEIIENQKAKQSLTETFLYPSYSPTLSVSQNSTSGVLLFGPPGTGKTLLAKSMAGVYDMSIITLTSSNIIDKYRGESEKILRGCFTLARELGKARSGGGGCVVFIDEVDSICVGGGGGSNMVGSEGGGGNVDESCRRLVTELLKQVDGIETTSHQNHSSESEEDWKTTVVLMSTTNHPYTLPPSLLRRFSKRLHIPLPTQTDIVKQLKWFTKDVVLSSAFSSDSDHSDETFAEIAYKLRGCSGAEVKDFVRSVCFLSVRRFLGGYLSCFDDDDIVNDDDNGKTELGLGLVELSQLSRAGQIKLSDLSPVSVDDFNFVLNDFGQGYGDSDIVRRCAEFDNEFGCY